LIFEKGSGQIEIQGTERFLYIRSPTQNSSNFNPKCRRDKEDNRGVASLKENKEYVSRQALIYIKKKSVFIIEKLEVTDSRR
jgi:hypothetical protein